ncbi:MAG: alpha/beta hydrolase [Bdellovibrio sp.]|nr:alpha/beta hydrolase [Bdellovibrio sp.]
MQLAHAIILTGLFSWTAKLNASQSAIETSISHNINLITPASEESCEHPYFYQAPPFILHRDGRLNKDLRQAALRADPIFNLHKAALRYLEGSQESDNFANAYADLSVTGKRSKSNFHVLHYTGKMNEERVLESLLQDPLSAKYSRQQLLDASTRAINRAYKVANVLPYGNTLERRDLGWIAVSGEDDLPYRPVNVPSAEYPQYDLDVMVGPHKVRTRYMIAESFKVSQIPPQVNERTLPRPMTPRLSQDAKVLIFVHGMDSRLEEAVDLFKALQKIAYDRGENWTIIAMDLPSSGYATMLDHRDISPLSALGNPRPLFFGFDAHGKHTVPVLDFMENFIVSFVDTLDQKLNFKNQIMAVIGGSLGGNLTFRLGRRHDLPWLKNVVTWSPASIWRGLADGSDLFKQIGVATAWKRAGGDLKNLEERPHRRYEFFDQAFGGAINIGLVNIVPAQPDQWWRTDWACYKSSRKLSRIDRQEIYNTKFRLWHWRLGAEQLIFSQQTPPDRATPRYMDNHIRMLLACGTRDDFNFTNICSSTKKTAEKMSATPGRALIIKDTGHSIHNERPNYFAGEIVDFLSR